METQVQINQKCSTVRRWWQWFCNCSPCTENELELEMMYFRRPNIPIETPPSPKSKEDSSESTPRYMVGDSGTEYLTMGVGIGKGAYSKVMLIKRVRDGHQLAAKSSFLERPASYRHLLSEYKILARLDHPNIIKPLDFIDYTHGISMIVFKYYMAGTLSQRVKMNGHLPESEVKLYTYQLCSALAYIHKMQIVHSDIKPSNIVCNYTRLCEHGPDVSCSDSQCSLSKYRVMLIDFGMAKIVPEGPEGFRPRAAGTGLYMAPEVFSTDEMVFKADMWSLGVSVYQMLTGAFPYGDPDVHTIAKTVNGTEAYLHTEAMAGVSHMGKLFIKRCLNMKVQARLSSQDALRHPWICPKVVNGKRVSVSAMSKITQLFCRRTYRRGLCDECCKPCVSKDDMQDLRALAEMYKTRDEANAMVGRFIPYPGRHSTSKASDPGPQKIQFSPLHLQERYRRKVSVGRDGHYHEDRRNKKVDIELVPHVPPARRVLPQVSPARRVLPQVSTALRKVTEISPARRVPHGRAIDTPSEQVHSSPRPTEYNDFEPVPGPSFRAQRWRRVLPPTPPWSSRQLPPLPITPDSEYV